MGPSHRAPRPAQDRSRGCSRLPVRCGAAGRDGASASAEKRRGLDGRDARRGAEADGGGVSAEAG